VDIIKRYASWLTGWMSEPDGGQSAALNRGLRMSSGLFFTWINSDDMLCRDALVTHATRVGFDPTAVYVGDCVHTDEAGNVRSIHRGRVRTLEELLRVRTVWHRDGSIDQPAALFPLDLARRVGGLNERNHHTMDYELWGRFLLAGARIQYTEIVFGVFRRHGRQKTHDMLKQTDSMLDAALMLVEAADSLPLKVREELAADLEAYRTDYPRKEWQHSGRLARLGLPVPVVTAIRNLKSTITKP
jgi:hypothetical protein